MLQNIVSSIAAIVLMIPPVQMPDVQSKVAEVQSRAKSTELPQTAPNVERSPIPPPPAPKPVQAATVPNPAPSWAIPWSVVKCESGGNYRAQNSRSSASGAYQMIQSTANNAARAIGRPELVGRRASTWPPYLQDLAAAWLWDGGKGKSHWKACL